LSENIEPFLVQEKIINDDGTPSDYLVRYLNNSLQQGKKTVKFPVTSVNGMTGDVVINLQDIVDGIDINYALLNEKIQEFIAALSAVRQEDIQRMADHQSDWHRWPYQSFHNTKINDSRMMTLGTEATVNGGLYKLTPTLYIPNYGDRSGSPQSIGGAAGDSPNIASSNSKMFLLFSVEKDITVNRLYISSPTFANDVAPNYCELQFAIYSAGIVNMDYDNVSVEGYRNIGYKRKIPVRFPNAKIWSSDVLSSVNRTTLWPSYIKNKDTVATTNSATLSWGFSSTAPDSPSFKLSRGVYFIAMAKYRKGNVGNGVAAYFQSPAPITQVSGLSINMPFILDTDTANFFTGSAEICAGRYTGFSIRDTYAAGTGIKVFDTLYADKLNAEGIVPTISNTGVIAFGDSLNLFTDLATGADIPITSIVRTDEVALVTTTAPHGLVSGDSVVISGVTPDEYNITTIVSLVGASQFSYYISGAPSAASGTMIANKVNTVSSGAAAASAALGGPMFSGAFTETTPTDKW